MTDAGRPTSAAQRAKVTAAKEGGGTIYRSDHSVPSDVSLAGYCRAIEWVKQYGCYT